MFRRRAACDSCSPGSPRDGHRRPELGEGLGAGSPSAAGSIRPRPRALLWKGGAPSSWPISIHSPSPAQRPAFVLLNKPAFFRGRMAPNLSGSCLSASQWLQGIAWRSEWVPCGAQKRRKIHFCRSKQCPGSRGVVGEGPSPQAGTPGANRRPWTLERRGDRGPGLGAPEEGALCLKGLPSWAGPPVFWSFVPGLKRSFMSPVRVRIFVGFKYSLIRCCLFTERKYAFYFILLCRFNLLPFVFNN